MAGCSDIRELLSLYLISELEEPELGNVRSHLADCGSCSEELDKLQKDMDRITGDVHGLKDNPRIEVRIKESIHTELHNERPASGRGWWFFTAAAAAVIIVVVFIFLIPNGPRSLWEHELGRFGKGDGGIAVSAGERLYIVFAENKTAYTACVDSDTGRLIWKKEDPGIHGMAADRSGLFVVEYVRGGAELKSLSPDTGEELWNFIPEKRPLSNSLLNESRPSLSGSAVFWRWGDTVYAVGKHNGKQRWSFTAEGTAVPEPVVRQNIVYTAGAGTVYALDAETGRTLFEKNVFLGEEQARISAVTFDAQNLYYSISSRDRSQDRVLCFDPEARKTGWVSFVPSIQHVQTVDNMVVVRGDGLYAFDRNTGSLKWEVQAEGCSPVTLVKGKLCYFDSSRMDSFVYLDPGTGKVKGRYELDGSCTGIAVAGDSGYVIASTGMLYKISF